VDIRRIVFEAHVTMSDGTKVTVRLDKDLTVTWVEDGMTDREQRPRHVWRQLQVARTAAGTDSGRARLRGSLARTRSLTSSDRRRRRSSPVPAAREPRRGPAWFSLVYLDGNMP
jgi:hypothetical protein